MVTGVASEIYKDRVGRRLGERFRRYTGKKGLLLEPRVVFFLFCCLISLKASCFMKVFQV